MMQTPLLTHLQQLVTLQLSQAVPEKKLPGSQIKEEEGFPITQVGWLAFPIVIWEVPVPLVLVTFFVI